MPTYEYECTKCGEQFDYLQSIKEAPKDTCEKCGGALTKLLSAGTGLIFKGSGFYITDYKTKSGGEGSGKDNGGKGTSAKEGGGGGKTEGGGRQSTGGDSKSGQESKASGESKAEAPAPSPSKSTGSSSSGKIGD